MGRLSLNAQAGTGSILHAVSVGMWWCGGQCLLLPLLLLPRVCAGVRFKMTWSRTVEPHPSSCLGLNREQAMGTAAGRRHVCLPAPVQVWLPGVHALVGVVWGHSCCRCQGQALGWGLLPPPEHRSATPPERLYVAVGLLGLPSGHPTRCLSLSYPPFVPASSHVSPGQPTITPSWVPLLPSLPTPPPTAQPRPCAPPPPPPLASPTHHLVPPTPSP
jgi:hypothetical protein